MKRLVLPLVLLSLLGSVLTGCAVYSEPIGARVVIEEPIRYEREGREHRRHDRENEHGQHEHED